MRDNLDGLPWGVNIPLSLSCRFTGLSCFYIQRFLYSQQGGKGSGVNGSKGKKNTRTTRIRLFTECPDLSDKNTEHISYKGIILTLRFDLCSRLL